MIRLFSTLLALVVLSLALYRVFRHSIAPQLSAGSEFSKTQQNPSFIQQQKAGWKSKHIFTLPLTHMDGLLPALRRGDIVVLVQRLTTGENCAFGSFTFLESRSTHFVFKAMASRRASQLENWARHSRSQMKWQIVKPTPDLNSRPFIQKCDRWLPLEGMPSEVRMVSTRNELFLSSKEFIRVQPVPGTSSVLVNPDLIRGGWRIKSTTGGWQRLFVQSAQNGLKQHLTVHFPSPSSRIPSLRTRTTQRQLSKPIALPGWD